MPNWDRAQWRAAKLIVDALIRARVVPMFPTMPDQRLHELHRLRQRWDYAVARGWHVAAATLKTTWDLRLRWLITDLEACRCGPPSRAAIVPTAAQVYRDLDALRDEFENVDIDPQAQTVTVGTDRIVLDEVDLGPFALVWTWSERDQPLRVIAQEPRRPDYPEDLTHPHVRDDELCLGEGQAALEYAFHAGRLCDAFLILRQILKTYNPDSAYASLARWTGRACHGCADPIEDDQGGACETCGEEFCGDCSHCCDACGDALCQGCAVICPECQSHLCSRCWAAVDGRRLPVCQACHDSPPADEDSDDQADETSLPSESDAPATDPDLQSDHLGEAALPAGCG